MKLPKTFKSKKSLEKWLDKNHKKLRDSIFTNSVSDIHYLVYYVQDNMLFCHFISAYNTVYDSHYHIEHTVIDCWGKLNGQSVKEFLEEDFIHVSDEMVQKYESLVRDDFIYNVASGWPKGFNEEIEYTIIDYGTDAQVLDYIRYLEDDITEYNNGKSRYVPTINERFAYLVDKFDSTYANEKDYVKTLDIRDKAVFYGANPEFDIFNKEWIKDDFGYWIVSYDSFTKKQAKEIYDYAKRKVEDKEFEIECKKQRAEKSYSKADVWNFNSWFTETLSKMLKDLADNHMGYPSEIDRQYFEKNKNKLYTQDYGEWISVTKNKKQEKQKEKAWVQCDEEWTEILNRMSYLLDEMDEEKCSWNVERDILQDKWWKFHEQFSKEYGNGESLRTEEEKKYDEEYNVHTHIGPERHPDKEFVKEYKKAQNNLFKFEKEMFKYKTKCKDELFDLMKKWFWNLWD